MNEPENKTWFPAKRHGYGWTFPNRWQGWAVLAVWMLLIVVGTILLRPDRHAVAYVVYDATVSAALLIVIVVKGERIRWRWGDDSDHKPDRI